MNTETSSKVTFSKSSNLDMKTILDDKRQHDQITISCSYNKIIGEARKGN